MAGRRTLRVGYLRALWRFFRDPGASFLGKMAVVAALLYVVVPADAVPDVVPVIGWLDDLGVLGIAAAALSRVIARYRGPGIDVGAHPSGPPEARSAAHATGARRA